VALFSESVAWRKEIRGSAGSFTTRLCHLIGSSSSLEPITYRQLNPDVVKLMNYPSAVKGLDTWWGRVLNAWLMLWNAVPLHQRPEVEQVLSILYGKPDDVTDLSAPPKKRHGGIFRDSIEWLVMHYDRYWSREQYEVKLREFFDLVRARLNENYRSREEKRITKEDIFFQALFEPTRFHLTGELLAMICRETRNMLKLRHGAKVKFERAEFARNPTIEFGSVVVNLREPPPQPLPLFAQLSLGEFPPLPPVQQVVAPRNPPPRYQDLPPPSYTIPPMPQMPFPPLPQMPFPPLPSKVST